VKADAYGLGAVPVVRALESIAPHGYGVSSIGEGEELRAAGIARPILLFTPARPHDFPRLRAARLTPTLGDADAIAAWAATGGGAWHLAVDTGMHRAGANHDAIDDATLAAATACPPEGCFTHLHSSEMDDGSMELQEERFRAVVARLASRPRYLHVENSGGIVRRSPSAWDLVRPGVFLYGVGGWQTAEGRGLTPDPVASLRARILEVRTVQPGDSVSYGATWRAGRVTKVATVACGYADGLRRHLGNHAHALVRGRPAPIAGVVTMDMAMLDVTDSGGEVGEVVTFLGRDGDAVLTAEQVAAAGGLSPYELLVGLKLRLPRFYTES
jgi:alanine racemase